MRKVKIRDTYLRGDDTAVHTVLHDVETNREIVCPLTGNACTPDCAAYETGMWDETTKYVYCLWNKNALKIGELIEEAKP